MHVGKDLQQREVNKSFADNSDYKNSLDRSINSFLRRSLQEVYVTIRYIIIV